MSRKACGLQRAIPGIQIMAHKFCRRACELFCFPFDSLIYNKVTYPAAEKQANSLALLNPPSTILIVNISNSTLINCNIGKSTYATEAERQPINQETETPDERCSCTREHHEFEPSLSPGPQEERPSINIHSSHLNCVIIGDGNYMHAE